MKNNKIFYSVLIFLVYISFIFSIKVSATESPFGSAANTGTAGSKITVEEQAKENGDFSNGISSKFKNIDDLNKSLDNFFSFIRWGIAFLTTLGTISSFMVFAMAFVRLANAPSAAFQRRNCYIDILKGGLSTVCLGGLTLVMTVFYKTFSKFITHSIMLSHDWKTSFSYALIEYKYLICGACGVLSLSMFVIFIKDILTLASAGENPAKRAESIKNLLITGGATIGLGGTGIFVAIFNGLLG